MADVVHVDGESGAFDRFDRDRFDSATLARGPLGIVGAVLREQGAVFRDLKDAKQLGLYMGSLGLTTLLFSAAYGAILGLFQPGWQTLYAAAKLPIVVLGAALMCTPTFYVFNSILGSRFTFRQTAATVLFLAASATMVLVAFAPIAWFFTVSTKGQAFIVFLHVLFCLTAALYGMSSLNSARRYLNYIEPSHTPINGAFLLLWFVMVLFVAFQLAWYLRPLMSAGAFFTGERGLFFDAITTSLEPKPFLSP